MRLSLTFSLCAMLLSACGEDTSPTIASEGDLVSSESDGEVSDPNSGAAVPGAAVPGAAVPGQVPGQVRGPSGSPEGNTPLLILDEQASMPAEITEDECANKNLLEVVHRDFRENHPDFEMPFPGDQVRIGLVESTLGADKKPVFKDRIGCFRDQQDPLSCDQHQNPTEPVIQNAESYNQWYNTVDGINEEFIREIDLGDTGIFESSSFFPLTRDEGWGITPQGNGQNENFLFTTEIHLTFTYRTGQVFSFRGDDDVWVFINNKLVIDLGSMHGPESGEVSFDERATELGITPGQTYPMDVFHAERHTEGSNFRIETNIECITPVRVSSVAR